MPITVRGMISAEFSSQIRRSGNRMLENVATGYDLRNNRRNSTHMTLIVGITLFTIKCKLMKSFVANFFRQQFSV